MDILVGSLRIGWEFLTHPRKTVDDLISSSNASKYSWTFLLLSVTLWTLLTGYQNLIVGETSRGREKLLGISFGPDIIVTLLTIPLGIAAVASASFFVSKIGSLMGGESNFKDIFNTLAFTLNIGSTFFDLQFEFGMVLTGVAWQIMETFPTFFYYAAFIMFAPILWSLVITIISLSHLFRLSMKRAALSFMIGVLPIFAVFIFIVA